MKTIRLIVFCSLFVCKIILTKSGDNQKNDDTPSEDNQEVKSSEKNSRILDQDQPNESTKDSIKSSAIQREPNVFQKILVPEEGPYCFPKILNFDRNADILSRRKTGSTYSPQQWDESLEIKITSSIPKGTIKGEWPYQKGQSRKKKEIRKYVKLKVSIYRKQEDYRLTGVAAERAFISRYYGFINPSENKLTDDLITFIDDTEKAASKLILDSGQDPLANFNSWKIEDKMQLCEYNINYSIVLFNQNIDFDQSRSDEIIRTQKTVLYKNSHLQSYTDTVDIVICPCIDITTDTLIDLGILPIKYKYKQDYTYAFVYNILKNVNNADDFNDVNVRALTKIDNKGLARKRKKRNRQQQKKREQKAEEERKLRVKMEREEKKANREEANENGEGKIKRALSKLLSFKPSEKII